MITKTYTFYNLINNRELFVQPMYVCYKKNRIVNFYKFIDKNESFLFPPLLSNIYK